MNYNRKRISAVLATTLIVLLSLTVLSSGVAATIVLPEVNKTVYDPGSGEWVKALTAELNDTLRFKCTITNPPGGETLTQIRFWDVLDCSLEFAGNSTLTNVSGVVTDIDIHGNLKPKVLHPQNLSWNLSEPEWEYFDELCPDPQERKVVCWEDNGDNNVSPCDQIRLTGPYPGTRWYHVDRVPYTLTLSEDAGEGGIKYFDSVRDWNAVDLNNPNGTKWFSVCGCKDSYTLLNWTEDICQPLGFGYGDLVTMRNELTGEEALYMVEEVAKDLVVSREFGIDNLLDVTFILVSNQTITIEYDATVVDCGVDNNTFCAKGWFVCGQEWRYSNEDVVTITVPCTVPSGEATDPGGLSKEVYTQGEPVYAVGSGFDANKFVDIYIVPFQQLNDSVTIDTLGIIVGPINVTTDENGDIGPELIWPNPVPGHYLMIFDDPDGDYNQDRDPLDEFSVVGAAPVVTPLGLVALIGLLSVIATSTLVRRKRR